MDRKRTGIKNCGRGLCWICRDPESGEPLQAFCACTGELGLAHDRCLGSWLVSSGLHVCPMCRTRYGVSYGLQWLSFGDLVGRASWSRIFFFLLALVFLLFWFLYGPYAVLVIDEITSRGSGASRLRFLLMAVLASMYSMWLATAVLTCLHAYDFYWTQRNPLRTVTLIPRPVEEIDEQQETDEE